MPDLQVHVPGYDKSIQWIDDATGTSAEIHVTGWDWDDGGDLVDVTNTGHSGKQAFVATIERTGANITAFYYLAMAFTSRNIRFGKKGTLTADSGMTTDFSIHCIIEKVHWKQVVNGVLQVNFDAKSDQLKADGTIVDSITRAQ